MKTKKVKSAGRFGAGYGLNSKKKLIEIENKQHKRQSCLFCPGRARRKAKGIWECDKCGKRFASDIYYINK